MKAIQTVLYYMVVSYLLKLWCVMNSEVRAMLSGMTFLGVFLR